MRVRRRRATEAPSIRIFVYKQNDANPKRCRSSFGCDSIGHKMQGKISESKKPDLMARPLIDLREMLERENKLLANVRFIERLKDRGEKIRRFRDEIERAIKIRQSMEETESFLARLSLGEKAILPKHPMVSAQTFELNFE